MAKYDKLVGVIGGMGPEATVDFMLRVLHHTDAATDQEQVRLLVEQNPHIPNRQRAMRGEGEDPGPALVDMARRLQNNGADFVVMPCNLAHAWEREIVDAIDIPFVSIVRETVAAATKNGDETAPIGLLTTPGCFAAGLYQQAVQREGRPLIEQSSDELLHTMHLVERIKAGERSEMLRGELQSLASALVERGAKILIAACTEFPLILDASMFDVEFVSPTDELAIKTVNLARAAATV